MLAERIPLADKCRGRWRGILPAFGIDGKYLTGKHGPCPICGGTDRYRFDDKNGSGSWICSSCGAGNGAELVMRKTGLDFKDAAKRIEEVAGTADFVAPKTERSEA